MSESSREFSAASLVEYRRALHELRPSKQLDERIAASIDAHLPLSGAPDAARGLSWRSFVAGAAAAAVATAVVGVLAQWRTSSNTSVARSSQAAERAPAAQLLEASGVEPPVLDAQWGDVSPWAGDPSIVRVRGTLVTQPGETQYWVDVRLGADGSMRIVKVIPVSPANNGSM